MNIEVSSLETAEDWVSYACQINPRKEALTIEKLRAFSGFENYTDEQAKQVIQSLEQLALIIYECASQDNFICIDYQCFVNCGEQKKAA